MLTNRRARVYERCRAAESLAGLGPQYHDEAVAALRQVLTDRRTRAYDRQQAARSLAELGDTSSRQADPGS